MRWVAYPLVVAALVACDVDSMRRRLSQPADGTERVGGEVVSTVGGRPIHVSEVRRLVDQTGLPPREVLRRLQARLLLAAEAEAQGIEVRADAEPAIRQALVQALLASEVETVPVTDALVKDAYDGQGQRFRPPERRASVHVLARLPKKQVSEHAEQAARRAAVRAIDLMRDTPDFAVVQEEVTTWDVDGFSIVSEVLPAVVEKGPFDAAFARALFQQDALGVLPEPVKSKFGYHAIRLTEIVPPAIVEFGDARAILHAEQQVLLRGREAQALLTRVSRSVPIRRQEEVIGLLGQIVL